MIFLLLLVCLVNDADNGTMAINLEDKTQVLVKKNLLVTDPFHLLLTHLSRLSRLPNIDFSCAFPFFFSHFLFYSSFLCLLCNDWLLLLSLLLLCLLLLMVTELSLNLFVFLYLYSLLADLFVT